MTLRVALFSLTAACAVAAGTAYADDETLPPAVKARHAYMDLNGFYLGQVFAMVAGKVDYDADQALAAATNLQAMSSMNISAMWVPGTDSDSVMGSRALPKIWENVDDVMAKYDEFGAATDQLVMVAADGKDALAPAVKAVAGTCSTCHKAYRLPDD